MSRPVFITGYGVITAVGDNAAENHSSLLRLRSGFGPLDILDTVHRSDIYACEIKRTDADLCKLAGVRSGFGHTRTALLAMIAAREAIDRAALPDKDLAVAGLVSATTAGGIRELERYFYAFQDPHQAGVALSYLDTADPGDHTERMADHFGMRSFLGTVSTACTSATNAIILGARLIAHGVLSTVICGGAEALSKVTINGFNTLMILDRNSCRPFDENRSGLNLGEGAAYLVLEAEEALQRSGRTVIARLSGYANVNDAFHQTASSPDGTGAFQAMEKTLAWAGLRPCDIDYINAHGTGTENNDLSEGLAIQALFGENPPSFSSTKPYTGHTTSAAGGVEAAYCLMAFEEGMIFPNLNFREPMKELAIRPLTELVRLGGVKHILSNSLGFGGSAATLLFSKCL
ncbi:MAG: 3-oxoacyl-[acyl-carrier-protein] synthase 2 [Syntrophus sp. SKADARSKE-3]|nr:3-oxoacyl-[acyl-carrier-protein] synthase 2 [Syntrophus sp. SKADARSKE-3]